MALGVNYFGTWGAPATGWPCIVIDVRVVLLLLRQDAVDTDRRFVIGPAR